MKTWRIVSALSVIAAVLGTPVSNRAQAPASEPSEATGLDHAETPSTATAEVPTATSTLPQLEGQGPLFVIPVRGQIEGALVYVFRRGLAEAERTGARAIVLDMDTPGGSLDAVWKIMDLLLRSPVPTITYVNPNAISGGALIALATDHIVMAPSGLIGDAKPILGSPLPFGAPQDVPDGLREKILSPSRAKVRAASQAKGRDERLGEAMMDESVVVERDGKVISAEGRILTLTSDEAAAPYGNPPKPLLSEGTFETLEEVLDHVGGPGTEDIRRFRVTSSERIARVLAGPFAPFLLGLGLLMLYIEARTPGFGIPGLTGLLLLGLWFWGQHIAALAGMGELMLFLLGVVLLAVEVFLIPGFGVTGVTGIVFILASILLAMVARFPGGGAFDLPADMLSKAVLDFTLALVVLSLGAWAAGGLLPKTPAFRRLMLQTVVDGHTPPTPPETLHLGLHGITTSPCRPGGVGRFAGERLDIVSNGDFLESGTPVELVARRANTWEVRPIPKA